MQNVDPVQRELQRLRTAEDVWMQRAVIAIFGSSSSSGCSSASDSSSTTTAAAIKAGEIAEAEWAALKSRPDVRAFVTAIETSITKKCAVAPGRKIYSSKVRLSRGPVLSPSPKKAAAGASSSTALNSSVHLLTAEKHDCDDSEGEEEADHLMEVEDTPAGLFDAEDGTSIVAAVVAFTERAQPEEAQQLLSRLMEVSALCCK